MKRRDLLGLLCGAAFFWPLAARAQQSLPLIGFLHDASLNDNRPQVSAFWEGMVAAGFGENRNVAVDYRWTEGRDELLPALATDLVRRDIAVLVTGGGIEAVAAAKRATATIPIVFVTSADPVGSGIIASLSDPGGNVTGVSLAAPELLAKRLEVLHKIVPQLTNITALVNPENPNFAVQRQYLADSAKRLGIQIPVVNATKEADIGPIFDDLAQRQVAALVVANDGFLNSQRDQLLALTAHLKLAAAFGNQEFVAAGGLVSYGPSSIDAYQQAGTYAGRILKGEKPADMPVSNPIEFELAVNLRTAKSLGLTIPPVLLATADQVIE